MASINATTSSGIVATADNTGQLQLQSAGTTIANVTSTGLTVTGTGSFSGDLSFNSGYGSAAVAYGCRAWVNFNGTGVVAIRASGNVTSITDNGTGDYTVNFTTAMPDTNYCGVALPNDGTPGTNLVVGCENQSRTKSTTAFHVWTAYGGNGSNKTLYDVNTVNVAVFR